MKAIKIIGLVLVIIIFVLFSIGLIVPAYEYESSIAVNAPAEKCWKVYHNAKLMNQWLQGFESLTLKSGDSLATGSQYEIVITDDGHRMVMSEKITAINTPTKVSYELDNDVLKSEFSFSFEGSSPTTITSRYKITGNNIAWRSILFLSKSYMTNASNDQLTSLNKVIEEQP